VAVSTERDPVALRKDLAGWLADRSGAHSVEVGEVSIPGFSGFSNETLLFDATIDGELESFAIRVEPTGHTVFPATAFDTQVQVMQALRAEGSVPVPQVRWFEGNTSILGARFACMRRVVGEVPGDNPTYHAAGWVVDLDEAGRQRLWDNGLDTMAAIHRVDRVRVGLGTIRVVTPDEQLDLDLAYRSFAAGDGPYPPVDQAFEVLAESVPPPADVPALCWGDSRIGNMIFDADQSVAAVLDWEMVTAGDPVQDLAWYLLLDRHGYEGHGVTRLPGFPSRAAVWSPRRLPGPPTRAVVSRRRGRTSPIGTTPLPEQRR